MRIKQIRLDYNKILWAVKSNIYIVSWENNFMTNVMTMTMTFMTLGRKICPSLQSSKENFLSV